MENLNAEKAKKKRHEIVTVCLWLGIIFSLLYPFLALLTNLPSMETIHLESKPSIEEQDLMINSGLFMSLLWSTPFIFMIGFIIGFVQLLRWKKLGFTLICAIAAIAIITSIFCMIKVNSAVYDITYIDVFSTSDIIKNIIYPLLAVGALWGVLQIKKDSVSCWEQLK